MVLLPRSTDETVTVKRTKETMQARFRPDLPKNPGISLPCGQSHPDRDRTNLQEPTKNPGNRRVLVVMMTFDPNPDKDSLIPDLWESITVSDQIMSEGCFSGVVPGNEGNNVYDKRNPGQTNC
jgi:hypothetical protein